MVDIAAPPSLLFLRDAELRRGIELLYFGYRGFTQGADAVLERVGLGRAHHRALYFIARRPNLSVSELLAYLRITKQSLGRVLSDLQARDLVQVVPGRVDRRQRLLSLTEAGVALERDLFEAVRAPMLAAYSQAGAQAVAGFWQVLGALVAPEQREDLERLLRAPAPARP
jgi:DNA-binding MarR family transcriptional regulator